MFDKLGQLKDLWKLKSQMEEIKKRLDNMVIKVDSPRHIFQLTISGSQEVKEVTVNEALVKSFSAAEISDDVKAVFNKAVRDSQGMAAQAMGNFGMPQA